jgi:membrane-bound lytic murein transglycosylase B
MNGGQAPAPGVADEQAFQEWLASLRREARSKGISDATLHAALTGITPVQRVIELDRHQPEFTQTFWSYIDQRVNDQRRKNGHTHLATHRDLLEKIQVAYGVPARYIVAFWGLETNFGNYLGDFRVIEALVTLAYDRRRSPFFREQLLDALKIIEHDHISPEKMTGSWAGAMGHMQFMPSTFIGHAVDYTGDGRKDIWQSLPDAFASAANFLTDIGWQAGETWGREVRLPDNFDLALATLNEKKTLKVWSALGVRRANGTRLPRADMQGSIVLPQGHKGPAFIVYENFRVIMRWNNSLNYAFSVGHLADRIVGMPRILNGRGAQHQPLSRNNIKQLQHRLNQLGFDAGRSDGLPGPRTKAAIRAFQAHHALAPDGYPSPSLMDYLLSLPVAPQP